MLRPLVLMLLKTSGYVKTFKDGDKITSIKLISFLIDDDKLLAKYKTTWINIEGLLNITLNALSVYEDKHIKVRTYGGKNYTKLCGLNVPGDGVECKSFTIISIDPLLVYENKYYLQVYLNNWAFKIVDKQMEDYFDDNLFETDKD